MSPFKQILTWLPCAPAIGVRAATHENNQLGAIMESIESNVIRTETVDFSFGEILNLHLADEIIINPDYQRLFRWTVEQRSRLIESILLKLPIPPIFLIENGNGVLELIDGLQRISSVLQFLDHNTIKQDELVLRGCDILTDINGMTYWDFNAPIRFRLKRAPIRAVIVMSSGDEYVRYEMFKRLNTGGSLLSAQEIRNCSSRMLSGGVKFYQRLQEMAADYNFRTAIRRLPQQDMDRRMNEELVLRFFAVRHYRDEFSGNVREWLDNFMEYVLFQRIEDKLNSDDFKSFFAFVVQKFGDAAFSRFRDGHAIGRLAPAYFEAVVGALGDRFKVLENTPDTELKEKLSNAFESDSFKGATGPGANSKHKMERRIEVVRAVFLDS